MKVLVSLFGVVVALTVGGCGAEQRPVKVAGAPPPDASTRVSSALASEGHVPDKMHSTDALVVTEELSIIVAFVGRRHPTKATQRGMTRNARCAFLAKVRFGRPWTIDRYASHAVA